MTTTTTETAYKRTTIKIPSATTGWELDAWKYIPTAKGSSPHPIIILAHGLAANKSLGLHEYAELYAAEGYASVVFDYRRWGSSDGTPRHVVKVSEQLEDYRTVINWVRRIPEFDEKKIVIWGSSLAGGHILQLASEDPDLAAAMGQCPYAGPTDTEKPPSMFGLLKTLFLAFFDLGKQFLGLMPYYVPTTSEPGGAGLITAPGAAAGYASLAKLDNPFPNQVNASSILQIASYKPNLAASSITCPLLLVVPASDNLCSVQSALNAAKSSQQGEVMRVGGGHFDLYPGHSEFDKALQAQLAFLHKHVPL